MSDKKPDSIVIWEKDGNRKWAYINDPLFQKICQSATGWLHCPKYTKYLRARPILEHADEMWRLLGLIKNGSADDLLALQLATVTLLAEIEEQS